MAGLIERFKYPGDRSLVEKLIRYINSSDDPGLFHIDVYSLAEKWKVDKRVLLELFIRGLHEGIFIMEWEYHCPYCGGVASESLSIHNAASSNFCNSCKVNFNNKLDDNIEVFFSIHPEVKKISMEYKEKYIKNNIDGIKATKMFMWRKPTVIKGVDIIQNPVFRELMGEEVLLPDQSLEIMKTTILFTDIKGSTQMYTDLGDSKAFHLVRDHFRILFNEIKKYNGVPVKTIGDAVMGSFTSQAEALKAALESQKSLISFYRNHQTKPENERIEVKIGLHTGTTLVVNLNGKLDYFGSTVNMAARIQGIAKPNEIVISENIFKNEESRRVIISYTKTVTKSKKVFKGLNGEYSIYRISME
ncbi:MAG: adenylate/guanylate cyclase domain-containing protein [Spirochaetes bacterium]|nr:adenylate/guanylate cyclase domain-containing protein [Spirochaetota bacterium]